MWPRCLFNLYYRRGNGSFVSVYSFDLAIIPAPGQVIPLNFRKSQCTRLRFPNSPKLLPGMLNVPNLPSRGLIRVTDISRIVLRLLSRYVLAARGELSIPAISIPLPQIRLFMIFFLQTIAISSICRSDKGILSIKKPPGLKPGGQKPYYNSIFRMSFLLAL